jgi:hypothetical protein
MTERWWRRAWRRRRNFFRCLGAGRRAHLVDNNILQGARGSRSLCTRHKRGYTQHRRRHISDEVHREGGTAVHRWRTHSSSSCGRRSRGGHHRRLREGPKPHHSATNGSFRPAEGKRSLGERGGASTGRGIGTMELELQRCIDGWGPNGSAGRQRCILSFPAWWRKTAATRQGLPTGLTRPHARGATSSPMVAHGGGAADAGAAVASKAGSLEPPAEPAPTSPASSS